MRFTASLVALLLASVLFAAEPKVHRDLPNAEPRNERQTLDVYAPSDGKNQLVVLSSHGGSGQADDKKDAQKAPPLVQIELKDKNGGDFLMRATELERSDKTSKVKVVTKKRIGSVGSSLFVVQVFYDIAKARKCDYFLGFRSFSGI